MQSVDQTRDSQSPAVAQVFDTTELLEMILLETVRCPYNVSTSVINLCGLFQLQRVCRKFHQTIGGSATLQWFMFVGDKGPAVADPQIPDEDQDSAVADLQMPEENVEQPDVNPLLLVVKSEARLAEDEDFCHAWSGDWWHWENNLLCEGTIVFVPSRASSSGKAVDGIRIVPHEVCPPLHRTFVCRILSDVLDPE